MSQVGQTGTSQFAAQQTSGQASGGGFNSVDTDSFMKLLLSELQNQDPLNPTDNSQMLQQIGQIRQIGATDSLTTTLSNLSNSQELVTASSLIGRSVTGLADDASNVDGVVDRITVETNEDTNSRSVKVHVGEKTMEIKNIRQIQTG